MSDSDVASFQVVWVERAVPGASSLSFPKQNKFRKVSQKPSNLPPHPEHPVHLADPATAATVKKKSVKIGAICS
jgi:hypothetical protein